MGAAWARHATGESALRVLKYFLGVNLEELKQASFKIASLGRNEKQIPQSQGRLMDVIAKNPTECTKRSHG